VGVFDFRYRNWVVRADLTFSIVAQFVQVMLKSKQSRKFNLQAKTRRDIMAVQRWTDEMLDTLANTVALMRDSMTEMRDSVADVKDNVQALLQVAEKHEREIEATKQKQAENDKRFYVLLEEVRYLNRGKQAD